MGSPKVLQARSTIIYRNEFPSILNSVIGPQCVRIFLSEGNQKFLFPNELGLGRFVKIGIPTPEFMGPFVGIVEDVPPRYRWRCVRCDGIFYADL